MVLLAESLTALQVLLWVDPDWKSVPPHDFNTKKCIADLAKVLRTSKVG